MTLAVLLSVIGILSWPPTPVGIAPKDHPFYHTLQGEFRGSPTANVTLDGVPPKLVASEGCKPVANRTLVCAGENPSFHYTPHNEAGVWIPITVTMFGYESAWVNGTF